MIKSRIGSRNCSVGRSERTVADGAGRLHLVRDAPTQRFRWIGPVPKHLSDWRLLTRTFLFLNKRLYRDLVAALGPQFGGTVLDIGCGFRPYEGLFANAKTYLGVDRAVDRRPGLVAAADHLPIASGCIDSLVCMEVLEHVDDLDMVMRELQRVQRSGGRILVTAPMSWNLHYEPHDYRRFTCYGLWSILEQNGYDVVATYRIGGLFSLVGSRLADGLGSELYARASSAPPRIRHLLALMLTVPISLTFLFVSRRLDRFQTSDAIGWAVVARRQ